MIHNLIEFGYSINPRIPHKKGLHAILRDAIQACKVGDTLIIPTSLTTKIAVHDTTALNIVIDDSPYLWAGKTT